jgi:hypothetical protein
MPRPKTYHINLSGKEIAKLKTIIRNKNTSKTVLRRCQVLMDIDAGRGKSLTHAQAAKSNAVSIATVTNIVKDYVDGGVANAVSLNRSINSDNARRKLDGRAEAKIIATANHTGDGQFKHAQAAVSVQSFSGDRGAEDYKTP